MGYESKLIVVQKGTLMKEEIEGKTFRWGQRVAMFDLCVVPDVSVKMKRYPETDTYFFADDGNTLVTADKYDEPLAEVPLEDAIKILEKAAEKEHYRRYAPCIQMLRGFDPEEWGELVVLHYGH